MYGEQARRCLGIEARALPVSHGYHSDLIAGARPRYRAALDQLSFSAPQCRIVSTITGASIDSLSPADFPALLERQFIEPVRLQDAVLALHRQGLGLAFEMLALTVAQIAQQRQDLRVVLQTHGPAPDPGPANYPSSARAFTSAATNASTS